MKLKPITYALASLLLMLTANPAVAAPEATPPASPSSIAVESPTASTAAPAASATPSTSADQTTAPASTPTTEKQEAAASTPANLLPAAPAAEAPEAELPAAEPAGFTTHGAIGARWKADGGENASYGKPTSNEICSNGVCYQRFERATLAWSQKTGTHLLRGAIEDRWLADGAANSPYGAPASEEVVVNKGAVEQLFYKNGKDGAFYWTPWGTGTRFVSFRGAIGSHWAKWGNFRQAGKYGFPTSNEQCGFIHGSCFQRFEKGTIVWSPAWGSVRIGGAIRGLWESKGGMNSPYGIPVAKEAYPSPGQTAEQLFYRNGQDGAIYWTNWGTGTHFVNFRGAIGSFWAGNGNFRSAGIDTPQRYGYPTTEEICTNGSCYQKFQYGIVTWSARQGVGGSEAQKCMALNNGRSKYSAQGAHRVALALAPRYSSYRYDPVGSHGTLYSCRNVYGMYIQDWKTPAAFGESGFLAPWKRINDYETGELLPAGVTGNTAGAYSPTGSFSLSTAFGLQNPGSGFSDYKTINAASRWGGDRNTWYYNKYIENAALGYPNENMWNFATRGDYRQGLMINYNRNLDGSVPSGSAGFAIMLHTLPRSGAASTVSAYQSWGCIAIDHNRMVQFLREGRDGDRMIMGVESEVMNW